MIIHVPHSSIVSPEGKVFPCEEITKMTDWYTDDLFDVPDAERIVFPYTRLFCDVERFLDDYMETKGMGICYTRKSDGSHMRDVSDEERSRVIAGYYNPNHKRLEKAVADELERCGEALIIDAHSFPALALPYEDDSYRPDICIGTSDNTPALLYEYMIGAFTDLGYEVAVNRPFAGTIVPLKYMGDKRVRSVMIEVNRGLYLEGREKSCNYNHVKADINKVLSGIERGI